MADPKFVVFKKAAMVHKDYHFSNEWQRASFPMNKVDAEEFEKVLVKKHKNMIITKIERYT